MAVLHRALEGLASLPPPPTSPGPASPRPPMSPQAPAPRRTPQPQPTPVQQDKPGGGELRQMRKHTMCTLFILFTIPDYIPHYIPLHLFVWHAIETGVRQSFHFLGMRAWNSSHTLFSGRLAALGTAQSMVCCAALLRVL